MSAEDHRSKEEILRAAKSKQAARLATKPASDKGERHNHGEDGKPPEDTWAKWRASQGLSNDPPKKQETPKKPMKPEGPDGEGNDDDEGNDDRRKRKKK
eukprot:901703-Amphidinium_carterae.1